MFGNIVNNKRLRELVEEGEIQIQPFDPNLLDTIHYPLYPENIFEVGGRDKSGRCIPKLIHNVQMGKIFKIPANAYVTVEVRELIVIPKRFVAQFAIPFYMIENGLNLSAGRMESPFGQDNQRLVFGIKNFLDKENFIEFDKPIAYIYFIDLTALECLDVPLTEEEKRKFNTWKKRYGIASDDGPFYE